MLEKIHDTENKIMKLELLNCYIPKDVQSLIDKGEIKEDFHYNSDWKFEGRIQDELVGLIAYTKCKFKDGKELPRFIHVLIVPKFRGKKEARILLHLTESHLKKSGYNQVCAHIKNNRRYMQRSATHHGYLEYLKDDDSKYYYKNI